MVALCRAELQRAVEAEEYEVAADIRKQMSQLEVSVNKRVGNSMSVRCKIYLHTCF